MHFDEKFWVALSFVIFIALAFKKVSSLLVNAMDSKSKEIENQLKQASILKKEAADIRDGYLKQQKEAEKRAKDIVLSAEKAAEKMLSDAKQQLESNIAQKLEQTEQLIKDTEKRVISEIKQGAVQTALDKFKENLSDNIDEEKLIDKSIKSLKKAS